MNYTTQDILDFLDERIFNPVKQSTQASGELKKKTAFARICIAKLTPDSAVTYFWHALQKPNNDLETAMYKEGFANFEYVMAAFRDKFPI